MSEVAALVLAAGKGTRMKSGFVKVLHEAAGAPLIDWPVAAAREAGAGRVVLVAGHQADRVQAHFSTDPAVSFALQQEQLGTGHAVACAAGALEGFSGTILILCGDVPLIRPETLQGMLAAHRDLGAALTVLTTHVDNPFGYGRVVKGEGGRILRIVEQKDATPEELKINEINSGIYCVESEFLFAAVASLSNDNAQKEYYLTDIVLRAAEQELLALAFSVDDPDEVMGVNDRAQLAAAGAVLRKRINESLMLSGVTMIAPDTCYIDSGVKIGSDTIIHPNVHVSGNTIIGSECVIEPSVVIRNCTIADKVTLKAGSVMADSVIGEEAAIGPMAHLRPDSQLGAHVKIGNFVETKKIVMGEGSKASHLTYLGDASIGRDVNIGCGTITCNYDGVKKHRTVIGDGVFVGSDVQFVAPITVGANSLIAAGTTVTQDIPPDSLALARVPQVNKVGWVKKKREG
ncbi:bifunctional protein GlmU [Geobacter sp. OR-1]|uniref:bifunctional UDP-N-acetylglucosamine diphosphorylase/glucosamine-1-phosphate N-acetyltransferase GlmU n=1 Tax=Geobacter sp. OR-1 TaxID=1266765 RepID=UPI0005430F3D|nr:bifunctional UDP-N-acetylglucosamine diphosphorylase/glucosamine-1-phosphate N-acetyltransferase GlmU [Geobacter sp. OR-1]GAM09138.1 bifunctional protein GlmU [Geobacter sp. OR-1]